MGRLVGTVLAVLGFLAGVLALVLPWASYRIVASGPVSGPVDVSGLAQSGDLYLLNLDQGRWYLLLLLVTLAALAAAVGGQGWLHGFGGIAAAALGIAGTLMAVGMVNQLSADSGARSYLALFSVETELTVGPATAFAIAAPLLLGAAAAVLAAVRRPGRSVDQRVNSPTLEPEKSG